MNQYDRKHQTTELSIDKMILVKNSRQNNRHVSKGVANNKKVNTNRLKLYTSLQQKKTLKVQMFSDTFKLEEKCEDFDQCVHL